jgi:D-glycero-alpha-D-manno-heptose-7-phosphate kinase
MVPWQTSAEPAGHIGFARLREPVGPQGQYSAAFGGITCFEFQPGGAVEVSPLKISGETSTHLESNLALFYPKFGYTSQGTLGRGDLRDSPK